MLWQLPPSCVRPERLDEFLPLLPRDTGGGGHCARRTTAVDGSARTRVEPSRPLRHASRYAIRAFGDPAFVDCCVRTNVALVVADTAGKWPYLEDVTRRLRLRRACTGTRSFTSAATRRQALARWARPLVAWSEGGEPEDAAHFRDETGAARGARRLLLLRQRRESEGAARRPRARGRNCRRRRQRRRAGRHAGSQAHSAYSAGASRTRYPPDFSSRSSISIRSAPRLPGDR
jgi:uncharacterized protein YecE (DUF72 family)